MPGVTDGGFVARRQPEIETLLKEKLSSDSVVGGFNFSEGPLHQLVGALSEQLAELWEAAEEVYASSYEEASGVSLDRVAAITGTTRRAATRSTVVATVDLDAGATLPAGSVAAVASNPDAQFRSVSTVTNSGASSAQFGVTFESVETGPVAAPATTLTTIVGAVSGWTAITNAADAALGKVRADDAELRTARRTELAALGCSSADAIAAALARLGGVEFVRVYQNTTSSVVSGRPAKSLEAVIWDGTSSAADDDEIAQAIWDSAPAGIEVHGGGVDSGTATDRTGAEQTVDFTRATQVRVYVEATVILEPGTASGWETEAKAAITALEYSVGEDVYASQLSCALQSLAFVAAVTDLQVATATPAVGASVAIAETSIANIDSTDITVST